MLTPLKPTNQPIRKQMSIKKQEQNTSEPLIDADTTIQEWSLLKRTVVAEQYPRDQMWKLWHLIAKFHPEFPNLSVLARLALTSSVHTAGCERGFSVQNRILTTFRNRLTIENQQKLMRVKSIMLIRLRK